MKLTIRDSGALKPLAGLRFQMAVGIHAQEASAPHNGASNGEMTVGEVATLNEFGAGNIPARSWGRKWADMNARAAAMRIRDALIPMARKQVFTHPGPLQAVARWMSQSMSGRILDGKVGPANAAMTLANKAPETRPLVDTKQFVEAIRGSLSGGRGWAYKSGPEE